MNQAANLMCPVEEQYRPPTGYYDFPYIYVHPIEEIVVAGAADPFLGRDLKLQQRTLQGDSLFVLRKVTRFPVDTEDTFMLYTPEQNQRFSEAVDGRASVVFPVVPEAIYPPSGSVYYDINDYASSTTLTFGQDALFFTNQILFQGVRRFVGEIANPAPSSYDYTEKPFQYQESLGLNWTYLVEPYTGLTAAAPRRFVIPVQDHDFELQRICAVVDDGQGGSTVVNNIDSPSFRMMLYDHDQRQLMNEPVNIAALSQSMRGNGRLFPAFPVPPIVYRANSQIMYDITSLLDDPGGGGSPTPVNFRIIFQGVRRIALGNRYGGSV